MNTIKFRGKDVPYTQPYNKAPPFAEVKVCLASDLEEAFKVGLILPGYYQLIDDAGEFVKIKAI